MKDYYYHINSGFAVFVKDGKFFIQQGGLKKPWGKSWKKVKATSLESARKIATKVRDKMFEEHTRETFKQVLRFYNDLSEPKKM